MHSLYRFALIIVVFGSAIYVRTVMTSAQASDDFNAITPDNVASLEEIRTWEGVDNRFVAASFNHSGDILSLALGDGRVRLLDTQTWETVQTLEGADLEGTRILFSRDDSRLMLSHWDGMIRTWSLETGDLLLSVDPTRAQSWYAMNADLETLWTRVDGGLRIQETDTEATRFQSLPVPGAVSLDVHPDGTHMAVVTEAQQDVLLLYEVAENAVVYTFTPEIDGALNGIGFSPDGTLVWASWQDWALNRTDNPSVIQFWSVETGEEIYRLAGDGEAYTRLIFNPNGERVAVAGSDSRLNSVLQVWNLESGEYLGDAGIPTGGALANFSPNGDLIAVQGGTTSHVYIWSVQGAFVESLTRLQVEGGPNSAPTFSPDAHFLLTVNGPSIRLWAVNSTEG